MEREEIVNTGKRDMHAHTVQHYFGCAIVADYKLVSDYFI